MKRDSILLFGLLIVFAIGLYYLSPLSRDEKPSVSAETEQVDITQAQAEKKETVSATTETAPAASSEVVGKENAVSTNVQRAFAQNLRALGQCLETQNSVPGEELEPTLRTLVDSIRGEWGESVIATEDWMQVDLETPEGEKRRIRVEMDFDNETQIQRKLKYSSVDAAGQMKPISLPEDQAVEPSDSLIASLESGNKVITREKFERVYFQNGEEIVAKQSNGWITELEVNRGNKSFKCTGMNNESPQCQCL